MESQQTYASRDLESGTPAESTPVAWTRRLRRAGAVSTAALLACVVLIYANQPDVQGTAIVKPLAETAAASSTGLATDTEGTIEAAAERHGTSRRLLGAGKGRRGKKNDEKKNGNKKNGNKKNGNKKNDNKKNDNKKNADKKRRSKSKLRGEHIPANKKVKDDYIVKLKPGVTDDQIDELCSSFNAKKEKRCERLFRKAMKAVEVKLSSSRLEKMMAEYDELIEFVEVNGIATVADATWGLDRVDQRALPLDGAFAPATGGSQGEGVDVFVLDTGLRKTHSEFESTRAFHLWSAYDEHGDDVHGHGTHCSGTIAGATYGVAKKAHVYGVKILSDSGSGAWSSIIEGCEKVIEHCSASSRPCVASMSIGGGYSASLNAAVSSMRSAGITVVVAAGNEDDDACSYSPASAPTAITVGATTNSDARSSFSNHGSCVDIYAPGSDITSATAASDTSLGTWSGTSMACPHVSGVAALMLADDSSLTPETLLSAMLVKATPDVLSGLTAACPNKLLFYGDTASPTELPTPAPTNVGDTNPPTTRAPTASPTFDAATCATSGRTYSSPQGTVSDGDGRYMNSRECSWTITTGSPIALTFESFSTEDDYDFLYVYDGTSSDATELSVFEGTSSSNAKFPPIGSVAVTASSGSMHIVFTSDGSVTSTGFKASWESSTVDSPTPSESPTTGPTFTPTEQPSTQPTTPPTEQPTEAPTPTPSFAPTTSQPTAVPSTGPSAVPTEAPTAMPTEVPTEVPSMTPTHTPSDGPSVNPTLLPSADPTIVPTDGPTATPTTTPTESPTGTPAVPTCTNTPTPSMARRGKSCADVPNTIKRKCNSSRGWRRNKYCQQSCFDAGKGYQGDTCAATEMPTATPTEIPTEAPTCMDTPTPWMARRGKSCADVPNTIKRKCNANRAWRRKKYCQQSCFDAGKGYDGDDCQA